MSRRSDAGRLLLVGLRGLRARLLLTVGSVLLVAISIAGAVVGPMYQAASSASYLVTRLQQEPNFATGLTFRYEPPGKESPAAAMSHAAQMAAGDLGSEFGAPQPTLVSQRLAWNGNSLLQLLHTQARLLAKPGACAHLDIVKGHCPRAPGEALLLRSDLDFAHVQLGDTIRLAGMSKQLHVVGAYKPPRSAGDYWFSQQRLASIPSQPKPRGGRTPYRPAPFVVTPSTFAGLSATWQALVDYPLVVTPTTNVKDLQRAVGTVHHVRHDPDLRGSVQTGNALPAIAHQVQQRAGTARATVAPAVISVILVALVLLSRLLSAAMDLRSGELALASLRGMSRRQMWVLGLLEPVLMLVISAPIGVVGGYLGAQALGDTWLVPGLPIPMLAGSWIGMAVVLLVTLAMTAGVVRASLREPLSAQIAGARRPRRASRWTTILGLVIIAAAVALVASTLAAGGRSTPSATDLALPIVVAVAVGLVVSLAVAMLARRWTRWSTRWRGTAGYVASRAIARRRAGVLVILPLTVALSIAVFAAGVYGSAAAWRASNAATVVGADQSYATRLPMASAVALTHKIDPHGRWLMAVAADDDGGHGQKLIVDAARLTRVSAWQPAWSPGRDAADVAAAISPSRPPVRFAGTTLTLGVDNDLHPPATDLTLSLLFHTTTGKDKTVVVGPFRPGQHRRTAAVPFCASGCVVQQLQLSGAAGLARPFKGTVTLTSISADGTAVPHAVESGWRAVRSVVFGAPSVVGRPDVTAEGLRIRLDSHGKQAIAALGPGDVPAAIPVLMGRTATPDIRARHGGTLTLRSTFTDSLAVHPVGTAESMPLLGPHGMMIDFATFIRATDINDSDTVVHILARGDTPQSVLDALAAHGITQHTDRSDVRRLLDQDAYALALNLYLVVAALVVLLAVAGLAANLVVQVPERRRDAASLRVIGVRRSQIIRAVVAEFGVVLGAAALAGIGAGVLAQYVVVRSVTLGYADSVRSPRLLPSLDVSSVVVLVAAVVACLLVVSVWFSGRIVRRARTSTLRESAQ